MKIYEIQIRIFLGTMKNQKDFKSAIGQIRNFQ